MPAKSYKKLVDVYPYSISEKYGTLFLLLKRSSKKIYSKQWRMVAGKVKQDESYWQAAYRELIEETGLYPKLFWTVPSVNQFYEYRTDRVYTIPAFAAYIQDPSTNIHLNNEHTHAEWVTLEEVEKRIRWPEQRRLMQLIHRISSNDEILQDWVIPDDHLPEVRT